MPSRHVVSPLLTALCILAFTGPLSAQASSACEDVSGDWAATIDLPGGGPTNVIVALEQTECEVTGSVKGMHETPIAGGRVEASTASFTTEVTNQANGGQLEIRWTLTVEGDEATGTFGGDMFGTIDFVGERVP